MRHLLYTLLHLANMTSLVTLKVLPTDVLFFRKIKCTKVVIKMSLNFVKNIEDI